MGRITRGFQLLGVCLQILRTDRQLIALPLISFACLAFVLMSFGGVAWAGGLLDEGAEHTAAHYLALGIVYFVVYFIGIFFNAAVVGAAMIRLEGGHPTIGDGIRLAASKIDKILGWSAIAATVGLLLHAAEERAGLFGRIVVNIIGAAWAAVTFFVVPVLLFEQASVTGSIRRSARLFKERWAEQMTVNCSIGLAMFVLMIAVSIVLAPVVMAMAPVGIFLMVVAFGVIITVGATTSGIFNAALYRYAVAGEVVGGFAEGDLRTAFAYPPKRGFRRRGVVEMPRVQEHFGPLLAQHEAMKAEGPKPVANPDEPQRTSLDDLP